MLHSALGEAVRQVIELVDLNGSLYTQTSDVTSSTIGQHVRHIVDHLIAYKKGVETGCLDYNIRNRQGDIETKMALAKDLLQDIMDWLATTTENLCELSVVSEISTINAQNVTVQSNNHRELVYLISHTYHHIAIAATIARSLNSLTPEHLGIAPATATYLRQSS